MIAEIYLVLLIIATSLSLFREYRINKKDKYNELRDSKKDKSNELTEARNALGYYLNLRVGFKEKAAEKGIDTSNEIKTADKEIEKLKEKISSLEQEN